MSSGRYINLLKDDRQLQLTKRTQIQTGAKLRANPGWNSMLKRMTTITKAQLDQEHESSRLVHQRPHLTTINDLPAQITARWVVLPNHTLINVE